MLNDKFNAIECEGLLNPGHSLEKERKSKFPKFIVALCTLNLALIALSLYLGIRLHLLAKCPDQSLGVYCTSQPTQSLAPNYEDICI